MFNYLKNLETRAFKSSNTGKRYIDEHMLVIDNNGVEYLEKIGEIDVLELPNSFVEEDAYEFLERLASGDPDVMQRYMGVYTDTTLYPTTLGEAQSSISLLKNIWNSLDENVRKEYKNDVQFFVANVEEDTLNDILGFRKDGEDTGAAAVQAPVPDGAQDLEKNPKTEEKIDV